MKVYKVINTETNTFWNGIIDFNQKDFDSVGISFADIETVNEDFKLYLNEYCNKEYSVRLKSECKIVEYNLIENKQFDLK